MARSELSELTENLNVAKAMYSTLESTHAEAQQELESMHDRVRSVEATMAETAENHQAALEHKDEEIAKLKQKVESALVSPALTKRAQEVMHEQEMEITTSKDKIKDQEKQINESNGKILNLEEEIAKIIDERDLHARAARILRRTDENGDQVVASAAELKVQDLESKTLSQTT